MLASNLIFYSTRLANPRAPVHATLAINPDCDIVTMISGDRTLLAPRELDVNQIAETGDALAADPERAYPGARRRGR
jgi:hypothetical protein